MYTIYTKPMLIGVVSDTHGLLRSSVKQTFENCDRIIHAGDIGCFGILHKLKSIAPVTVVRGNTDKHNCFNLLKNTEIINFFDIQFYIIHDIKQIDLNLSITNIKIVVCGHTHYPKIFKKNGITYINPGNAGHKRSNYPISVCLIYGENGFFSTKIITIEI